MTKIEVCALASGSSGNCFYVSDGVTSVLIDAGISAKQIIDRLTSIGQDPNKIDAIFITHEHTDHIRGADVFSRYFDVPIYATRKTLKEAFICSNEELINSIKNDEEIKIGNLVVKAFPKSHDAVDPVFYVVSKGKKSISVITDAGHCCNNITQNVNDSDFLFIESNHDVDMLERGPYPYYLKKLIGSDKGHLSNKQAALCVLEHASSKLRKVVLSHVSRTNNTPEIALKTFDKLLKERKNAPELDISLKECPTEKFRI
jgi:phosphoribosyl 1,2-cyclic phosphodiesterase